MPDSAKCRWIYLDQNKWIDLSRAYYSRPDGEKYRPILHSLQEAIKHGDIRLPISSDHIVELSKAGDVERRKKLAHVMAMFSHTDTIAPQHSITPYEIDNSIVSLFLRTTSPMSPPTFGKGVKFAFGKTENQIAPESTVQELRLLVNIPDLASCFLKNPDNPPVPEYLHRQINYVRQHTTYTYTDIRAAIEKSDEMFEYILSFPEESERVLGLTNFTGYIHRIVAGQQQIRDVGLSYDRETRRRGFAARLVADPIIQELLQSSLKKVDRTLQDFLKLGREQILAFWDSIPTLHVEMVLEHERDEQRNRRIQTNDVIDVSFLSVAIPYCDIVITERFWVDLALRHQLDQKYKTIFLTDLADLARYLPNHN